MNLKKLNLTFNKENHVYVLNEIWVPSVTSVISVLAKPWLAPWASKMACETVKEYWKPNKKYTKDEIASFLHLAKHAHTVRKETAASTGTDIHSWLELYLTGKNPEVPDDPEIQNAINQFRAWELGEKIEWLGNEIIVGNEEHQFAGCVDAIARLNGKLCIIDFKSSKSIYQMEYALQLTGYQIALESMDCEPIEERWVLRFPKDNTPFEAWRVPSNFEDDKQAFLAAIEIYKYTKKYEKKDSY